MANAKEIIGKLNELVAAVRTTEQTPDRTSDVRAAVKAEIAVRLDLQLMIQELMTEAHAARTDLAALRDLCRRLTEDPIRNPDIGGYCVVADLFEEIAARSSAPDGGE